MTTGRINQGSRFYNNCVPATDGRGDADPRADGDADARLGTRASERRSARGGEPTPRKVERPGPVNGRGARPTAVRVGYERGRTPARASSVDATAALRAHPQNAGRAAAAAGMDGMMHAGSSPDAT